MKERSVTVFPDVLPPKQKKSMRELLIALLDSTGNQREYLISVLLSQANPEAVDEPSLKVLRSLSASIIEILILHLRSGKDHPDSCFLDFCKYINHLPLSNPAQLENILKLIYGSEAEPSEEQYSLFRKVELLSILTKLKSWEVAQPLIVELQEQVTIANPKLYIVYQLSRARYLQYRDKRLQKTALWLDLVSDVYQQEGAQSALFVILKWINMLNWGRETQIKKVLMLKFGAAARFSNNIISSTLLFEMFSLENKLVSPSEKMHIAKLLFKLPPVMLTVQQLQYLHFFTGNFYSGMRLSIQESIRYYQHSNYYLHKCWTYLHNLSRFLRENLATEGYAFTMPCLERWVIELGSQISLQDNAYVDTLHTSYNTINELYHKVEELSITDNLTGLKNRRFLNDNLYHMFHLVSRHNVPVCFAMLDIDQFKQVNDKHGHLAGDIVLKDLAKLILGSFRKSDVVVRYGGDEFFLILFDTKSEQFMVLMESLRQRVEMNKFAFQGSSLSITVSIGVSCGSVPVPSQEYLDTQIALADTALYQAKNSGRNKVVCTEQ